MEANQMSALHLISGIINAPRFHREIEHCPIELTERCVHLLTNLGQNREFAIRANYEMMEFLTRCILPFDDAGYMRVSRYFIKELLSVVGPQHKLWGAASFVMLSTAQNIEGVEQYQVWQRLNARFFEVLLDVGVISQEDERRLKAKSKQNPPPYMMASSPVLPTRYDDLTLSPTSETKTSSEENEPEEPEEKQLLDVKEEVETSAQEEANTKEEAKTKEESSPYIPSSTPSQAQDNDDAESTPQLVGRSVKVKVRSAFGKSN